MIKALGLNLADWVRFKVRFNKIKGVGNVITIRRSKYRRDLRLDIIGSNNSVLIDSESRLNGLRIFIRGSNARIVIGRRASFGPGSELWIEDDFCMVTVGENTTFENVHIAVTEAQSKVEIGKDCMFAKNIEIRTGDSHSLVDVKTGKRINFARNVLIGDHVWVASRAMILKGVSLSSHSVVAAGSIVTKSFDECGVLIGGIPAGILRRGISWSRQRIIKNE